MNTILSSQREMEKPTTAASAANLANAQKNGPGASRLPARSSDCAELQNFAVSSTPTVRGGAQLPRAKNMIPEVKPPLR